MPLTLKFNHVLSLSEARYASAALAEWVGFEIGTGDQAMPVGKIQEMMNWLSGVKLVLEIPSGTSLEQWNAYQEVLPFHGVEMDAEFYTQLSNTESLNDKEVIIRGVSEALLQMEGVLIHTDYEFRTAFLSEPHRVLVRLPMPSAEKLLEIMEEGFLAATFDCEGEEEVGMRDFSAWDEALEGAGIL